MAKKSGALEVKTPYPKEEKKKKNDVEYIGNELVKLSNRLNEIELSVEEIKNKVKRVSGRMGL